MSAALRLSTHDGEPVSREHGDDAADMISQWLAALCVRLRLPADQREQVRDELGFHLEERVRELMVTGVTERQAASRAIAELGDADVLAQRFHAAHIAPRRRRLMNMMMIGIASAAVLGGAVVMRPGTPGINTSVFQPEESQAAWLMKLELTPESGEKTTWDRLFELIGNAANKPVSIHWNSLENIAAPGAQVDTDLKGITNAEQMIQAINEDLRFSASDRVEFRNEENRIVVASTTYFDRRETRLVTFDLTELIRERIGDDVQNKEAAEQIAGEIGQLICKLVEPESWAENGGDRARFTIYGAKMFLSAPKRLLAQVEWVLKEIKGSGHAANAAPGAQGRLDRLMDPLAIGNPPDAQTLRRTLKNADPSEMRELLRSTLNELPSTKECPFPRRYDVDRSDRMIGVTATAEQLDLVAQLIAILDADAAEQVETTPTTVENYPLSLAPADVAVRIMERAVSTSPALRERTIVAHASPQTNSVVVRFPASLKPQIAGIIGLIDRDWSSPEKTEAGAHLETVPVLTDLPLISRLYRAAKPTSLHIRADGGKVQITNEKGEQIEADVLQISPAIGN